MTHKLTRRGPFTLTSYRVNGPCAQFRILSILWITLGHRSWSIWQWRSGLQRDAGRMPHLAVVRPLNPRPDRW